MSCRHLLSRYAGDRPVRRQSTASKATQNGSHGTKCRLTRNGLRGNSYRLTRNGLRGNSYRLTRNGLMIPIITIKSEE